MPSVEVRDLSITYGEVRAVSSVAFRVAAGEFFFLLGPSGCGKSSMLRAIAGLVSPSEGRILLGDVDITDLPPNRRPTAMVFQHYALWPHMSVAGNVAYGLEVRGLARRECVRRASEALERVDLAGYETREPETLSGGEQQRVALARALVIDPQVLLLDEPLSNLDARLRDALREKICAIIRELGITAIYVTHDTREALTMADRLAIMRDGTIEQIGAPREVYGAPATPFAAHFVGDINSLPATVRASAEDGRIPVDTPLGSFHVTDPGGWQTGDAVTLYVRPEHLAIAPAGPGRPGNGTVVGTSYGGVQERVTVTVGTCRLIALRLAPPEPLPPDQPVTVEVAPERILTFPAE